MSRLTEEQAQAFDAVRKAIAKGRTDEAVDIFRDAMVRNERAMEAQPGAPSTPLVPFAVFRKTSGGYRPPIVHWTADPFPSHILRGLNQGRSAWPQLYTICGRYIDIIDRPMRVEEYPEADVCSQCQKKVEAS